MHKNSKGIFDCILVLIQLIALYSGLIFTKLGMLADNVAIDKYSHGCYGKQFGGRGDNNYLALCCKLIGIYR